MTDEARSGSGHEVQPILELQHRWVEALLKADTAMLETILVDPRSRSRCRQGSLPSPSLLSHGTTTTARPQRGRPQSDKPPPKHHKVLLVLRSPSKHQQDQGTHSGNATINSEGDEGGVEIMLPKVAHQKGYTRISRDARKIPAPIASEVTAPAALCSIFGISSSAAPAMTGVAIRNEKCAASL